MTTRYKIYSKDLDDWVNGGRCLFSMEEAELVRKEIAVNMRCRPKDLKIVPLLYDGANEICPA